MERTETLDHLKACFTPVLVRDLKPELRCQYADDDETVIGFYIMPNEYYVDD